MSYWGVGPVRRIKGIRYRRRKVGPVVSRFGFHPGSHATLRARKK